MNSNRLRVQEAIVNAINAYAFPVVTYQDTGVPNNLGAATESAKQPILCNAVQSTFGPDPDYGQGRSNKRERWQFEITVSFSREVLLELFEDQITETPLRVVRDEANDLPQIDIDLIETRVEHPVQHEGSRGTRATFIFQAVQGRR